MSLAARPYLATAGIVLVGAALITVAPGLAPGSQPRTVKLASNDGPIDVVAAIDAGLTPNRVSTVINEVLEEFGREIWDVRVSLAEAIDPNISAAAAQAAGAAAADQTAASDLTQAATDLYDPSGSAVTAASNDAAAASLADTDYTILESVLGDTREPTLSPVVGTNATGAGEDLTAAETTDQDAAAAANQAATALATAHADAAKAAGDLSVGQSWLQGFESGLSQLQTLNLNTALAAVENAALHPGASAAALTDQLSMAEIGIRALIAEALDPNLAAVATEAAAAAAGYQSAAADASQAAAIAADEQAGVSGGNNDAALTAVDELVQALKANDLSAAAKDAYAAYEAAGLAATDNQNAAGDATSAASALAAAHADIAKVAAEISAEPVVHGLQALGATAFPADPLTVLDPSIATDVSGILLGLLP